MTLSCRVLAAISALMVLFSLIGCEGEETGTVEPTLTSLWDNGLMNCANLCHEPGGAAEDGPDLSTKALFRANLVGRSRANDHVSWFTTSDCGSVPFISARDATNSTVAASLIFSQSQQLIGTGVCTTTSYNIHLVNGANLDSNSIADPLIEWINSGALNN